MPENKHKPTVSNDNHDANVGQRGGKQERTGGKSTIGPENHESNVGERVTRDDGDNDDRGELD